MAYPSDLTDTQWQCIEKILEDERLGRKRTWPSRSILNAIFYVSKGGIQWRMMPTELPPWQTVYYYYRKFATRQEARLAVFEYIESFYNRKRRHSALGYLTPCQYESLLYKQAVAA